MFSLDTASSSESNGKTTFYSDFQRQAAALSEQIDQLKSLRATDADQRAAVDRCLAGISDLSIQTKNVSGQIPTHDQRTYSEAIKALSDKLQSIRSAFAPKKKFAFKNTPTATSSSSTNDPSRSAAAPSENPVASSQFSAPLPVTTSAHPVAIARRANIHRVLPLYALKPSSSASIINIHHCIIDLSTSTFSALPFASLTIKGVTESLLICGSIDGAAHITGAERCVLVVSSRQVRMHECQNCTIYLRCSSRSIIEDCTGMRFAPLPEIYDVPTSDQPVHENNWDQIDDFKWLKAEHSPNWSILDAQEAVPKATWQDVRSGNTGRKLDDLLKSTKVV